MEVAKSFERDGKRYRPGDPLPPDLDKTTLAHYQRHGMVREAKPSENKPAAPARKTATPKVAKPAAEPKPGETKADANAPASGDANPGDGSNPEDGQQQLAGAGAGAVDQSAQAASGVDQV
jgi:hypothetical protein